jgi:hypothetical protein
MVPIYSVKHVIQKSAASVSGARRPAGGLAATALLSAGGEGARGGEATGAGGGSCGADCRQESHSRGSSQIRGVLFEQSCVVTRVFLE